ncbi:MAG: hydroxymethylbilane synthase [Sphingobacteriia bacterium]|nr:hydroxymethylbilane synthase [Sphingobacteriia bacterium]
MNTVLKIGTRDSQLAVWQATFVKDQLAKHNIAAELVLIKSDGDIDLVTPLYAMGVQGVFTKTLDAALLSKRIDIAVHSMKDVPTQLAQGIQQAAVLKRANVRDLLIVKGQLSIVNEKLNSPFIIHDSPLTIATSSIRRRAQWLNRYPNHTIENLRGNVNTRLRKVDESNWHGAIFAAAGLERINLRPENAIELDWMLPAPAQGAIMIVCREEDNAAKEKCMLLNDEATAICVKAERDFLKTLLGGCSTPISALAEIKNNQLHFRGNIFSLDGKQKIEADKIFDITETNAGLLAADEVLANGGAAIVEEIRNGK